MILELSIFVFYQKKKSRKLDQTFWSVYVGFDSHQTHRARDDQYPENPTYTTDPVVVPCTRLLVLSLNVLLPPCTTMSWNVREPNLILTFIPLLLPKVRPLTVHNREDDSVF